MFTYLFLFPLLIVLLTIPDVFGFKRFGAGKLLIISLSFAALVGLRATDAGSDTKNYVFLFQNLERLDDVFTGYMSWKGDYFFSFLTFGIKQFSDSEQTYLMSLAFFSVLVLNFSLLVILSKYNISNNVFLPIALFYMTFFPYLLFGNVLRQGVAISLTFLALSCYPKKVCFYFIILLAAFSHKSALVFLFFPVFESLFRENRYKFPILMVSMIVCSTFLTQILAQMPYIGDKIRYYSNNFIEVENIVQIIILTLMVSIFGGKALLNERFTTSHAINFFIFTLAVCLSSLSYSKIAGRFLLYLTPILPFVLLEFSSFYKQQKSLAVLITVLFYLLGFIVLFLPQVINNITY